MVSSTATTSIFFCFVIRDSGYMTTHQRRCLQCLSAQLLVCDKNLNCNCQRHQATLSIAGTLLFPTVDVRFLLRMLNAECKFQHLASSVHKMGMVLDSVQNDAMLLNRAMKEASLDSKDHWPRQFTAENS